MGALPQASEIFFEVQRKRSNEIYYKYFLKKAFQLKNTFLFLLFGSLLLSNLITFHLSTLIATKQHTYKEILRCSGTSLCSVQWFVFFQFLAPFTLGGHNFLISNPFLIIITMSDVPREEVQVLFGHQKQHCSITGRSTLGSLVSSSFIGSLAGSIPTYLSLMTGG
jgi:hypothetical protein